MANRIISKVAKSFSGTDVEVPLRRKMLDQVDERHIAQHNQTFHASLYNGIRCFTDSCTYSSENGLIIKGWVFSEDDEIKDIEICKEGTIDPLKSSVEKEIRRDVERFYDPLGPTLGEVGFTITCTESFTPGEKIHLRCNNTKDDVLVVYDVVKIKAELSVNDSVPGIIVIDNFYNDPMAVREIALQQEFLPSGYHKGKRTKFKLTVPGTKKRIEAVLGKKITDWDSQPHNTVFQSCTPIDPLVYHYDNQAYAAMVFLTPNPPPECGTSFYRHKEVKWLDRELEVGKNNVKDENHKKELEHQFIGSQHDDFLDPTKWELTDSIANKFNRFVMFDSKQIHAASKYFGTSLETGRLFHMMFFNIEE